MSQHWWTRRWLEGLQRPPDATRLVRGRSYASRGRVLELALGAGRVEAWVQGSRARPYHVSMRLATLPRVRLEEVSLRLLQEPLRAGELPAALEQIFTEAGVPLFPTLGSDLRAACSCPDWFNPCKHIAAVYYLLGEALERDPFLLVRLRGIRREQLAPSRTESLPLDPWQFWRRGELPAQLLETATPARLLESMPSQGVSAPLLEALLPIYSAAASLASQLLANEDLDSHGPPREERP